MLPAALTALAIPTLTRLAPYIPRVTNFLSSAWNNAPAWSKLATVASAYAVPVVSNMISNLGSSKPTKENQQSSENLSTSIQTSISGTSNQALPTSPPTLEASFPSLPDMQESFQQRISQNPYIQAHKDFMSKLSEGLSKWIAEKNPRGQAIIKAMNILMPFIAQSENIAKLSMQDEAQRLAMEKLAQSAALEQQKQDILRTRALLSIVPNLLLLPPEVRDVAIRQVTAAIPNIGAIQSPAFQSTFGGKSPDQVMADLNEALQYATSNKKENK